MEATFVENPGSKVVVAVKCPDENGLVPAPCKGLLRSAGSAVRSLAGFCILLPSEAAHEVGQS